MTMTHGAPDPIGQLHAHRRWLRDKMIQAARSLSADDLQRPFAMGPGSVFATLAHCWFAETVWINTLERMDPATTIRGIDTFPTLDALLEQWAETDARWDAYLARLSPADLVLPVVRIRDGKHFTTSVQDVLLHVCTHQMYHAAQCKNMLRQLGASDLPTSDFIVFARENWSA